MNTLVDVKNKVSKYNLEFESESNPITKDEKFDLLLETTRERVKRERTRTTFTPIQYTTKTTIISRTVLKFFQSKRKDYHFAFTFSHLTLVVLVNII